MGDLDSRLARLEALVQQIVESCKTFSSTDADHEQILRNLVARDSVQQARDVTMARFEERMERRFDIFETELAKVQHEISAARGSIRVLTFVAPFLFALVGWLGASLIDHQQTDHIRTRQDVQAAIGK